MILQRLLSFLVILFFLSNNYAQVENTKSSRDYSSIKDTIQFDNRIDELFDIVSEKSEMISIKEIDDIIEIGHKLKYTKGLGDANSLKARVYQERLESIKAIKFYEKSIFYYKKTDNQRDIAISQNSLYIVENRIGNIEKGAYYLLEAKNYFEKIKDTFALLVMYNNLGSVHQTLNNLDISEDSFLKAISLAKQSGELQGIGNYMNNLAYIYIQKEEYDKAKRMTEESLIYNRKDSVPDVIAFSYTMFGEIALVKKEFQKSRKYYDSAYYFFTKAKDNLMIIDTKQRIGFVEYKLGNYKKAEKLYSVVRDSLIKNELNEKLLVNYRFSSKLDSARGDFYGALSWQHKYQQLSDQIASNLSIIQIEKKEDFYKNELEQLRTIDKQKIKEQRNKEKLFRYRVLTLIILGVLFICLLFALWIIRTRKERKYLINKLHGSNQVKNKLFSIISHDLKNEVHGLEGSLNLMQADEISTEEFKDIVPLLAERTNQTSILLNNLLNWSKSQMKALKAKPVNFDVTELISSKFVFFKPKANLKNIKLVNKLDSTIVLADRDMIGIVAQNLIANAIKFCKSGDSITLMSKEKDDYYEIAFADTGVGIDPANLSKLFAEETFTTHGTQNESGTGLGLRICRELVELNKGNIRVESTLGKGSTFYITLPKPSV